MSLNLPHPLKGELEYVNKILAEIFKESDRSVGVLLGSEMDVQLEKFLTRVFLPKVKKSSRLLEREGALSTFSSRIEISYRMGLIPEVWHHDLHVIRDIRNKCAHGQLGISFSHSPLRDIASNLIIGRRLADEMVRDLKLLVSTGRELSVASAGHLDVDA
jgi:hypothetical protein